MIELRPIGGEVNVGNAARRFTRRCGWLVRIRRGEWLGLGEFSPLDEAELGAIEKELRQLEPSIELDSLDELELSSGAHFAVETALLDIKAQQTARSVAALLSATAEPVLASTLLGDPREGAALAPALRCAKLKVGPASEWQTQADAIELLSERHPKVLLRLDFNATLEPHEAHSILADIDQRSWLIDYVEDPTAFDSIGQLDCATDIAIDAPLLEPNALPRVAELAALGKARVAVLKPALHGGLRRTFEIARSLPPALDPVISHLLDGPIALAAYAELACAVAPLRQPARAAGVGPHAALSAYKPRSIAQSSGPWLRPHPGGLTV